MPLLAAARLRVGQLRPPQPHRVDRPAPRLPALAQHPRHRPGDARADLARANPAALEAPALSGASAGRGAPPQWHRLPPRPEQPGFLVSAEPSLPRHALNGPKAVRHGGGGRRFVHPGPALSAPRTTAWQSCTAHAISNARWVIAKALGNPARCARRRLLGAADRRPRNAGFIGRRRRTLLCCSCASRSAHEGLQVLDELVLDLDVPGGLGDVHDEEEV